MDTKPSSKQKVMATPLPGGGVMQTPMLPGWKGAQFGGAFATVVKKAGRGTKTNAGNAIVVTCSGTHMSDAYPSTCQAQPHMCAAVYSRSYSGDRGQDQRHGCYLLKYVHVMSNSIGAYNATLRKLFWKSCRANQAPFW